MADPIVRAFNLALSGDAAALVRFLLANVYWFAEAFRIDGVRYDAVSTALYLHRAHGKQAALHGSLLSSDGLSYINYSHFEPKPGLLPPIASAR